MERRVRVVEESLKMPWPEPWQVPGGAIPDLDAEEEALYEDEEDEFGDDLFAELWERSRKQLEAEFKVDADEEDEAY